MSLLKKLLLISFFSVQSVVAFAAIDSALLKPLAGDDADARIDAVNKIATLANEDAFKVLTALKNDTLYAKPDGQVFIIEDDKAYNP
ncbi:MAG: urea ABC transporter permease subunit UrtB, partial [Burkholderiaceae bacterium]